MRLRALLLLALVPLVGTGQSAAQNPQLEATVGPGFTISLRFPGGADVRQLDPGTYDITVRDLADIHNFHLSGPGVDQSTSVAAVATVTWTVTFREGRYRFECDPHSADMNGNVVVGNPPPVTPPPPPPPPSPPPAPGKGKGPAATRLVATVGPGNAISLRSAAGAHLHGLKAGRHAITVRDRTARHSFHLQGAGVNRKTGVAERRTVVWIVILRKGLLRYFSDAAAPKLRGSVRVS